MKKNWLNKKVVVITGASSGFGKILCRRLIKDFDCTVIGVARNEEKLKALKEELDAEKFSYRAFDVSKKENWLSFYEFLNTNGILIDVLINNAGVMPPFFKFERVPLNDAENTVNTNFMSAVYSVNALMPVLKKSGSPAIINVSSAAGLVPVVGTSIYSASKAALRFFTESLQAEYRKEIYVAGIYPGLSKTSLFDKHPLDEKSAKKLTALSLNPEKAVNKMLRKIKKKRKRIVIGTDTFFMRLLYFLMPRTANRIIGFFFKKSKLKIFDGLYK